MLWRKNKESYLGIQLEALPPGRRVGMWERLPWGTDFKLRPSGWGEMAWPSSREEYSRQQRNYEVSKSSGWKKLRRTWMKAAGRWVRGTLDWVRWQKQTRDRLCWGLEILEFRLFLKASASCHLPWPSYRLRPSPLRGLCHSPPAAHSSYASSNLIFQVLPL